MRRWLALACALLWPVLAAQTAHAQTPPEYDKAIRAALQEYQAGNWAEAIMLFRRAHALAPSARTNRGLGLSYFEAREYVLAARHLKAALEDVRRPLTKAQRDEVGEALGRARTMVGEVVLQVGPAGANVLVDGRVAAADGGPILLAVGPHTFDFQAKGYVAQQRTVDVVGEQRSELRVELERKDAAAPGTSASAAATGAEPSSAHSGPAQATAAANGAGGSVVGPIIVLGTGGAVLASALVTGLMENAKEQKLVAAGCETTCDEGYADLREQAKTLQLTTNVLLAAGGALVATGALWWWLGSATGATETADVEAGALCLEQGCAVALSGKF